jgi:ATP-binding protein involved in chromosome partitioning
VLLEDVPTTILVASGKGGVGKTFVSVELARTIADAGSEVGLLDVDLTTPDSDHAVADDAYEWETPRQPERQAMPSAHSVDGSSLPVRVNGVQLVSKGLEVPDYAVNTNDERMQLESMNRFLRDTQWDDETTHLIVDTPPGTGFELQNVLRDVRPDQGFIVTTGTVNSVRDACRTHELFRRAGVNHAVVANMRRAAPSFDRDHLRERLVRTDAVDDDHVDAVVNAVETAADESAMPLHDDEVDLTDRFSVPVVADVPFTRDRERVREELRVALDRTGLSATLE